MHEMEIAPQAWLLWLLPLFLLLAHVYTRARKKKQQQQPPNKLVPPSPPALPVIGHLHLVGSLPHVSLRCLARKHNHDLMLLRLGAMPVLVVSSPRAAEAVLRTHDHVFASRPPSLVAEVLLHGSSDVGFAPFGDYWRRVRKLITTHLLSVKKVQSFRLAREEEVSRVLTQIGKAAAMGEVVDMGELLSSFTNDMVCRAVAGRLFGSQGHNTMFRKLTQDTSRLLGGFNVEEFFPVLARLGALSKAVRTKTERVKRRWDELLDKLIQDHESHNRSSGNNDYDDFTYALLSAQHEYGLTRDHVKSILIDVFFGAIDTSAQVLEFAIAELMRKPHLMDKLQAEVRSSTSLDGKQILTEASINNMTYLRAVIKESLRLHPVAPLLAPHFSMTNCTIDGYMIPSGIQVLVNAWAIGRDSRFWEDPEEFVPERFLDGGGAAGVNFNGNDFQFLPFGSGRRMCPGLNFGIATIEVMLANLMHHFHWDLPPGMKIDMTEVFGLAVRRREKLLLLPKLCT
ncbi:hypothetical protein U9M48_001197 [Paspalum notatum var. saurae]|uniref:Uncharacterized protein n=1 Tax=Paspalum notatum var. saurae TaxID=547442 RepID=A0AAQ3PFL6_PASNO